MLFFVKTIMGLWITCSLSVLGMAIVLFGEDVQIVGEGGQFVWDNSKDNY